MNPDARMLLQIGLHHLGCVEAGIVTNDVEAAIGAIGPAQVIEVSQEGSAVSAFCPRRDQAAGIPRQ